MCHHAVEPRVLRIQVATSVYAMIGYAHQAVEPRNVKRKQVKRVLNDSV